MSADFLQPWCCCNVRTPFCREPGTELEQSPSFILLLQGVTGPVKPPDPSQPFCFLLHRQARDLSLTLRRSGSNWCGTLHRADSRFEGLCFQSPSPHLQDARATPRPRRGLRASALASSGSGLGADRSELFPTKGGLFKTKQNNFSDCL